MRRTTSGQIGSIEENAQEKALRNCGEGVADEEEDQQRKTGVLSNFSKLKWKFSLGKKNRWKMRDLEEKNENEGGEEHYCGTQDEPGEPMN